jgi:hypothetical protein
MRCADCGEGVLESERAGLLYCFSCKLPLHGECSLIVRSGDSACESCYNAENTRFALVMAKGTGDGREPIRDENERGYAHALPGKALKLVADIDKMVEVTPWDAALERVPATGAVAWFGEDGD